MIVGTEPAGIRQLVFLQREFTTLIIGKKAHHHLMGKRPGLGTLVSDVANVQSGLFLYFPDHRLLKAFPWFDKTGNQAVEVPGHPGRPRQQELATAPDNHNYTGRNSGVPGDTATVAPASPLPGMCLGALSAATAIAVILPPLQYLEAGTEQIRRRDRKSVV